MHNSLLPSGLPYNASLTRTHNPSCPPAYHDLETDTTSPSTFYSDHKEPSSQTTDPTIPTGGRLEDEDRNGWDTLFFTTFIINYDNNSVKITCNDNSICNDYDRNINYCDDNDDDDGDMDKVYDNG